MPPSNNTIWMVCPHVRSTYTQDGAVLLDLQKGVCYGLNATAARVWRIMEDNSDGSTVDSIVSALERYFQIPRQQLAGDTEECLEKLQQMGAIQGDG